MRIRNLIRLVGRVRLERWKDGREGTYLYYKV